MGARLLPRTLPELFAYSLALEREATKRYAELERFMREVGVEHIADEFERIGREEREQYELIALGTSGRELPELAGWELSWHFMSHGTQAFYNDVADNSRDDAVRAFPAEMANDEQRHVLRLETLLERQPDPAASEADEDLPPAREIG